MSAAASAHHSFPKDGSSVEILMAKARQGASKVKNSGKSNYQIELSD